MDQAAEHVDVVIAGGGMAGLTLALALSQAGLEVAVVEATPKESRIVPSFDGRTSAIAFANFRQWRALGLGAALSRLAQPITEILITDGPDPGASRGAPSPAFLHFDVEEVEAETGGEPLGWVLENRHIRAALGDAMETSGARTITGVVKRVSPETGGVAVTLKDGRTIRGAVVVAADGRASGVRTAAGIGVQGWTYAQAGLSTTLALERPHNGVAHQHFLPGGPLAILPLIGDERAEHRASLVWTEGADRADALIAASPEAFEAHLARRFGDMLGRPRLIGPRIAYPLRLQVADRMTGDRTALIGDAAHVIHPIAGQGLNLGLKDVAALAEVLIAAARLGEDIGSETVLAPLRWRWPSHGHRPPDPPLLQRRRPPPHRARRRPRRRQPHAGVAAPLHARSRRWPWRLAAVAPRRAALTKTVTPWF
jgi:2-octaprenyl-6-methoxyphenol hydroxylase